MSITMTGLYSGLLPYSSFVSTHHVANPSYQFAAI